MNFYTIWFFSFMFALIVILKTLYPFIHHNLHCGIPTTVAIAKVARSAAAIIHQLLRNSSSITANELLAYARDIMRIVIYAGFQSTASAYTGQEYHINLKNWALTTFFTSIYILVTTPSIAAILYNLLLPMAPISPPISITVPDSDALRLDELLSSPVANIQDVEIQQLPATHLRPLRSVSMPVFCTPDLEQGIHQAYRPPKRGHSGPI
ncbi:hypothetical protein H0H87_000454 [Tephrocybe sp. NHM501043]|nr:hypothetical protein H0H87_000454 [Tephrocybe sp. NHM501043]